MSVTYGRSNVASSGITPSGTINITENGTVDVTNYATADVNVKSPIESGWSELVKGNNSDLISESITNLAKDQSLQLRERVTGVYLPNCTSATGSCFGYMPIKYAILPKLVETSNSIFYGAPRVLEYVILNSCRSILKFFGNNCSTFNVLMLGYNGVCSLFNVKSLEDTAFRNGTGGTVYVPYNQVANYQVANVWKDLESTTFLPIQKNLVALYALNPLMRQPLEQFFAIVPELPTTDIDETIVYFIETATSGTYEQWFHGSGSWEQLANITLEE